MQSSTEHSHIALPNETFCFASCSFRAFSSHGNNSMHGGPNQHVINNVINLSPIILMRSRKRNLVVSPLSQDNAYQVAVLRPEIVLLRT
jgi:hypothetical protein